MIWKCTAKSDFDTGKIQNSQMKLILALILGEQLYNTVYYTKMQISQNRPMTPVH